MPQQEQSNPQSNLDATQSELNVLEQSIEALRTGIVQVEEMKDKMLAEGQESLEHTGSVAQITAALERLNAKLATQEEKLGQVRQRFTLLSQLTEQYKTNAATIDTSITEVQGLIEEYNQMTAEPLRQPTQAPATPNEPRTQEVSSNGPVEFDCPGELRVRINGYTSTINRPGVNYGTTAISGPGYKVERIRGTNRIKMTIDPSVRAEVQYGTMRNFASYTTLRPATPAKPQTPTAPTKTPEQQQKSAEVIERIDTLLPAVQNALSILENTKEYAAIEQMEARILPKLKEYKTVLSGIQSDKAQASLQTVQSLISQAEALVQLLPGNATEQQPADDTLPVRPEAPEQESQTAPTQPEMREVQQSREVLITHRGPIEFWYGNTPQVARYNHRLSQWNDWYSNIPNVLDSCTRDATTGEWKLQLNKNFKGVFQYRPANGSAVTTLDFTKPKYEPVTPAAPAVAPVTNTVNDEPDTTEDVTLAAPKTESEAHLQDEPPATTVAPVEQSPEPEQTTEPEPVEQEAPTTVANTDSTNSVLESNDESAATISSPAEPIQPKNDEPETEQETDSEEGDREPLGAPKPEVDSETEMQNAVQAFKGQIDILRMDEPAAEPESGPSAPTTEPAPTLPEQDAPEEQPTDESVEDEKQSVEENTENTTTPPTATPEVSSSTTAAPEQTETDSEKWQQILDRIDELDTQTNIVGSTTGSEYEVCDPTTGECGPALPNEQAGHIAEVEEAPVKPVLPEGIESQNGRTFIVDASKPFTINCDGNPHVFNVNTTSMNGHYLSAYKTGGKFSITLHAPNANYEYITATGRRFGLTTNGGATELSRVSPRNVSPNQPRPLGERLQNTTYTVQSNADLENYINTRGPVAVVYTDTRTGFDAYGRPQGCAHCKIDSNKQAIEQLKQTMPVVEVNPNTQGSINRYGIGGWPGVVIFEDGIQTDTINKQGELLPNFLPRIRQRLQERRARQNREN